MKMSQIVSSFNGILVIKLICKYLNVSKADKRTSVIFEKFRSNFSFWNF